MSKAKKFNPTKFRELMSKKIKSKGYRGVSNFVSTHGFHRNPLAKAMIGETRPTVDSLNRWCKALECTAQERNEIISSVYVEDIEQLEQANKVSPPAA